MRTFLSDLHLESPESQTFKGFAALLARLEGELYILGDLTEIWVGDDDDGPLADALRNTLADAGRRVEVFVMHGNRDFLLGERFASDTGATLLTDPTRLGDGTLLAHGDAFCVDDQPYQQMRALFRSEAWQAEVLGQPLEARRELARSLRGESRAANANKAENIMDVTMSEVDRIVGEHGARRLLHGHTHRPGRHRHDWGYRYVLGDWQRCGWLGTQSEPGREPELACFSLGGRYGI